MLTSLSNRHVDTDPVLTCEGDCGRSWRWSEYWHARMVVLGDSLAPEPTICDECLARADRYHERVTSNEQLSAFVGDDPREDGDGDE